MAIWRLPVNLTWNGPGSPGVNVWHIRTTATDYPDQGLQPAVDAVHKFYADILGATTPVSGWFKGGMTWTATEAVEVTDRRFQAVTWTALSSGSTSNDAPPSNQLVISWRTNVAARRGMGRTFLGPLSWSAIEADGTPQPAFITAVQTAAQTLVDASTTTGNLWAVGIYGLQQAADASAPKTPKGNIDYAALPHVLRDITSFRVRDQFAVLRKRRD